MLPRLAAPLLASLVLSNGLVSVSAAAATDTPTVAVAADSDAIRTALVASWYQRFLGREADAGAAWWVNQLAARTASDVLWNLMHTREYRNRQIDSYYADYLGRPADSGSGYWKRGDLTLEDVAQNVLASDELRNTRFKGDRYDIITYWYISVLGRKGAPPSSQRYWVPRLEREKPFDVLRAIYYAPEGVNHRLDVNFRAVLDRLPTQREREYWYQKQVESDVNVKVLLAATPEYQIANV